MGWIIVVGISIFFFLWGLIIYFVVGDHWPPNWRYGLVNDVPGQSVYAVQGAEKASGTAPLEEKKIRRQHVMGPSEKDSLPERKGGS